mgnify:CR=1 FL=1
MKDSQEIKSAIYKLGSEDLDNLGEFLRHAREDIIKAKLAVGSQVSFKHKHRLVEGSILKLNPSKAKIETEMGTWNVPYTFLSLAK